MTNMDPRVALQETLESLLKLQPGNAALSALKAVLPDLAAEQAASMLSVLSAQLTDTANHQAITVPSTAGEVSPTTQRLIDTVLDRDSRVSAIQKLGEIKDPAAVPALIEALQDVDSNVSEAAADALGKIKDPRAVPALIAALKDEDWVFQAWVFRALVSIGKPAIPALIEAVKDKDEDSGVRQDAAVALEEIDDPRAVPDLIEALNDEDPNVRYSTASALKNRKDPAAVPALIAALKDEYVIVREAAARALGKIKDPAAVPALTQALKDKNSEVRGEAAWALVSIGKPAVPALKEAIEPRGLFERLGFDLTGRRERLRDVIQRIDESES